jgi:outer membrane protein
MKKLKNTVLAVAAVAVLAIAAPAVAQAQEGKFGVVDMGKVLREATAAKSVLEELEAKRKEFQSKVEKEEKALREMEQGIAKQREKLSKEDFEAKVKEFQEKLIAAQKSVQNQKTTLDKAFVDTMGKLRLEILKVAADVAKEKGLMAVLNQEALLLADPKMDITDSVISGVNKNVKKIPVVYDKK